jgi:hypothetical protein
MRRTKTVFLFAGAVVAALSCGGSEPAAAPTIRPVAGVYSIATVNGTVPPLTLGSNDTARVELISGAITLGSDGSFVDVLNVRNTVPSGVTLASDTARGNYSRVGATILLEPVDGHSPYQMEVTDELTLTEAQIDFFIVYRRK